jgi:hypothetical protein
LWSANPAPVPSSQDLFSDIAKILASPYLSRLKEYFFRQNISIAGTYQVTGRDPGDNFSDGDVQRLVALMIEFYGIPFSSEALYFVMMPPGVTPEDKAVTGAHSAVYETVGNQDVHLAWVQYRTRDKITEDFSHELVEMLTDPEGDSLQVDPRDAHIWHEIGDVCCSTALVNGVSVQAYWSAQDNACVIPTDVPVKNRQITCIHKGSPLSMSPGDVKAAHLDPHVAISTVGGISIETNDRFVKTHKEVIKEIQQGVNYFVIGADGSRADVVVRVVFPPWEPQGVVCIATTPDHSAADNLLSLPEC